MSITDPEMSGPFNTELTGIRHQVPAENLGQNFASGCSAFLLVLLASESSSHHIQNRPHRPGLSCFAIN
jgi:hypothetical protein